LASPSLPLPRTHRRRRRTDDPVGEEAWPAMGLRRGVVLRAAVLAAVLGFAAAGFISSRSHSVTASLI